MRSLRRAVIYCDLCPCKKDIRTQTPQRGNRGGHRERTAICTPSREAEGGTGPVTPGSRTPASRTGRECLWCLLGSGADLLEPAWRGRAVCLLRAWPCTPHRTGPPQPGFVGANAALGQHPCVSPRMGAPCRRPCTVAGLRGQAGCVVSCADRRWAWAVPSPPTLSRVQGGAPRMVLSPLGRSERRGLHTAQGGSPSCQTNTGTGEPSCVGEAGRGSSTRKCCHHQRPWKRETVPPIVGGSSK